MFSTETIAKFSTTPTPFYAYDLALLENTLIACQKQADSYNYHVHYALKANFNERVVKMIQQYGFGVDCVSGNEVTKAIELNFKPHQIVFAGVGKSDKEITEALNKDIFCFNVESLQELEVINQLAGNISKKARIAIRLNPNVDAKTHQYITTGLEENKFGINAWELDHLKEIIQRSSHIELLGIHFHVGSQITDLSVFQNLCYKVNEMQNWFTEQGFHIKILNVGGGLGVNYQEPDNDAIPDFDSYFSLFNRHLQIQSGQEVHFELGRSLVAQCGSLIARVLYTKKGLKKNIVILDAGMTELMRPALYQAYHKIENLSQYQGTTEFVTYDVVGPICESSDTFAKNLSLPVTQRGNLIAIRTAGAYGEVMASRYNLRDTIRHLYVEGDN